MFAFQILLFYLFRRFKQMTENGFTQNNSKGLFTFYKQQQQTKQLRYQNRKAKKHHESLPNSILKKSVNKEKLNTLDHQQVNNVSGEKKESALQKKHQIYTSKHVFSLKFNSPRKNGYYLQLTAARNHRSKTETERYSGNQVITKLNNRYLVGELSVRQIRMNQFKQLFIPKKDHLNPHRRNPMKMNQIIGRLFDEETKTRDELGLRKFNKDIEETKAQKKSIQPIEQHVKNKKRLENYLFRDVLELRKKKIQNNHFWEQIKQRKSRGKLSRVDMSKKLQEWIKGNNLNEVAHNHMPSIKKIVFSINEKEDYYQEPD